jgi:hypothetical protein
MARKGDRMEKPVAFESMRAQSESAIWPAACPLPGSPKDDDQYRYQDHQQIVKVEFKRRLKPLKVNGLINQGYPLFIGKFINSKARYEHDEVGNRSQ